MIKFLASIFRRIKREEGDRPGTLKSLTDFEKLIGYDFKDKVLLDHALKHRSIIFETKESRVDSNERLEFLGDAVLDLIVGEKLFREFPEAPEGALTRMKSIAVSGKQLAIKGRRIGLGSFIQMSAGEERNGGRNRRSILEDAMEAIIGALYLDSGLETAENYIAKFITNNRDEFLGTEGEKNYKSILLEYVQGQSQKHPIYEVVSADGPDHAKTFHIEVLVDNKVVGSGHGRSKKQAEQQAAKVAIDHFGLRTDTEEGEHGLLPE